MKSPARLYARARAGLTGAVAHARKHGLLGLPAGEVVRALIASIIAVIFVQSGVTRLPSVPSVAFRHPPVIVYSEPMTTPAVVTAVKRPVIVGPLGPLKRWSNLTARAPKNDGIAVTVTRYCLNGTTRRDHWVREGIIAADPRVFPLARYVELFVGRKYLGRFLVDDTGSNVKGATVDVWTPSCSEARRFGRQQGTAMLVSNR